MSVSEAHSTYQGLDLYGLERLVSVEIVSILWTGGDGLTDSVEAIIRLLIEKTVLKLVFAVSESVDVALCDAKITKIRLGLTLLRS
jgi:hypothetical protein